jgi:hypothetical protein
MRRHPRSLEDCLMADAGLARLSTHAKRLVRLQRIFESTTPLARLSRIANVKLGRIFIFAASNAVAVKLRQLEPRLTVVFRSEAPEVTGIDIRVQPTNSLPPRRQPLPRMGIGKKQKQGLTSLAESLPENSALRAALENLLSRAKG